METYNVTFIGLYFSLTCQVRATSEDDSIDVADTQMLDTYGWQVQACSHEVIVEKEEN